MNTRPRLCVSGCVCCGNTSQLPEVSVKLLFVTCLLCHMPLIHACAVQAAMVSWAEIMVRRRADAAARERLLRDADRQLQGLVPGVSCSHKNLAMV